MPTPSEADDAAGGDNREPESDARDTEGDSGTSAEKREPADTNDTEPRESADLSDSDLLSSFDEGLKEAGGDGEASETDADKDGEQAEGEPKAKDGEESPDEAEGEDKDDADAEAEGEPEVDPDALTETERKSLSKTAAKKIDKLVKLKPAARFGDQVFKHAADVGLVVKGEDGSNDFRPMSNWLNTAGFVNKHKVEDRPLALADVAVAMADPKAKDAPSKAAVLRQLADRISPAPKTEPSVQVVMMPEDLAALVANEHLKPDEAERIAIDRLRKDGKLKVPEVVKPPEPPPKDEKKDAESEPDPRAAERHQQGTKAAAAALSEIQKRHKDDWTKAMTDEVVARVKRRAATVEPEGFAQLVKDQAAIVLAAARGKRPAKKAPTNSPRPGAGGGKTKVDDPDSWDSAIDEVVAKAR